MFQVATGNVGSEMIKRIADRPDLELIGVHCYSPEKIGKDVGEFAGLAPNGVKATGSVEEIIAAKPDVLTFHGVFPDEDLYVKVLGRASISSPRRTGSPAGTATPTTRTVGQAGLATPPGGVREGRRQLLRHRHEPGLNQILGVVCSADVAEIENVTTIESVDVSCHHSQDTWIEVGYGSRSTTPDPRQAGEVHPRLRRQRADDGRLLRPPNSTRSSSATNWARAQRMSTSAGTRCPRGHSAGTTSSTRAWSTVCHGSRRTSSGR